jgi:hypothetical protein
MVISTVLPASPAEGVYVKANGLKSVTEGVTIPAPFSVIVTLVALPPNELPLMVTGVALHVLPLVLLSETAGGFAHVHDT